MTFFNLMIVISDLLVHSFRDQDLQVIVNLYGLKMLICFIFHSMPIGKSNDKKSSESGEHQQKTFLLITPSNSFHFIFYS